MAVTAWKLPGTVVAPGWTNPNNIKAVDGAYASKAVSAGGYSGVIRGEAFGFTTEDIPAGSTIDGIEAEAVLNSTGVAYPTAFSLYAQKVGGTNVGSNKASSWNYPFDASVVTRIAGGATDKWGVNPTAAEAIAATFAVAYEFQNVDAKFSASGAIGSIRLRFHYTEAATTTTTTTTSTTTTSAPTTTTTTTTTAAPTTTTTTTTTTSTTTSTTTTAAPTTSTTTTSTLCYQSRTRFGLFSYLPGCGAINWRNSRFKRSSP